MMDLDHSEKINAYIAPELGVVISGFYQLLKTNNSDPLTIPGRIYKPIEKKVRWLRLIGGRPLANSIGHPLSTYEIMKSFDNLLGSFQEKKSLFGSTYSLPRNEVINELELIKAFANDSYSQIRHVFK